MQDTAKRKARVVLGFDWGTRSIGVAIGQSVTATATPLQPLPARDGIPNWSDLQQIIEEWQPDLFVVGLPLNMDASESDSSIRAARFGRRLEGRFGICWTGMDERLSSFEVKSRLRATGQAGLVKKGPIDSLAAKLILESWFSRST
ncbi:MAG: Holliday junction resolvase RuvX [Pseudomonadales bacterium]|jgi:putative Holliday junction resolvase|nr:Holliday junction resolvase RuvX [Pseudomonadales bacterium]MDP7146272.1 Holliday junction resolvase RuvX [Pseudomonadales bacterium]MDP7359066.1 Holliday junction resolvase RuvX [Pseudomonadales bacterium]HJN52139.1 Holliday junction resolvase RuvX [Pseudomonadales bacterium]|tara:strand:+ start:334 stop:771 length:438 start_codon:yes stop_codon:yes gene_type:complete